MKEQSGDSYLKQFHGLPLADAMKTISWTAKTSAETVLSDRRPADWDGMSEVVVFGRNQCGMLGVGDGHRRLMPTRLNFSGVLELARVSKISCSWYHTVLLTDLGLIYTWGDGSDGALGHNDTENSLRPRLVEVFSEKSSLGEDKDPILFIDVDCAADKLGAHTAAVTTKGKVFTWGQGGALGHGNTTTISVPKMVDEPKLTRHRVSKVTCGGCFTMALTVKGWLFSWGKLASGRLGHGSLPQVREVRVTRRRRRAANLRSTLQRKQIPRFLLRPQRIDRLKGTHIKDVAAGEAHSLAVDSDGRLYAWGQGNEGQLGLGSTGDIMSPTQIEQWNVSNGPPKIVAVACGSRHSVAVTSDGKLYTWGGSGGCALGHSADFGADSGTIRSARILHGMSRTAASTATQRAAEKSLTSSSTSSSSSSTEVDVLPSEEPWLRPRLVRALGNERINIVAAGAKHTCAVTADGAMFVWGGAVDTHWDASGKSPEKEPCRPLGVLGDGQMRSAEGIPRLVSNSISNSLCYQSIRSVSCGGWHTVAVTNGPQLGMDLRRAYEISTNPLLDGKQLLGSDLTLVVAGRPIFVHRVVLACRSRRFDTLIQEEEKKQVEAMMGAKTMDSTNAAKRVELLLPELSYSVAIMLVEFMYTDTLRSRLDPSSQVIGDLLVAAEEYELPRLRSICQAVLHSAAGPPEAGEAAGDVEGEVPQTLPSSLALDMSLAVGARTWADVCFVSSTSPNGAGREIYAHSVMLMSRSEYFYKMLSPAIEAQADSPPAASASDPVEVELPDDSDTIWEMLHFLYTGHLSEKALGLPPSQQQKELQQMKVAPEHSTQNDGLILKCLSASGRYRMPELGRLCSSIFDVSTANCVHALTTADVVGQDRLREAATGFIVRNLDKVVKTAAFEGLTRTRPALVAELLQRVRERDVSKRWPPLRQKEFIEHIEFEVELQKRMDDSDPSFMRNEPFPWLGMSFAAVGIFGGYFAILAIPEEWKPVIPVLNVVTFLIVIIFTVRSFSA
eukprot:g1661.t1